MIDCLVLTVLPGIGAAAFILAIVAAIGLPLRLAARRICGRK